MITKKRSKNPSHIEDELLFRADHTCCICKTKRKDVQIHHIDGNPANNKIDNLTVLCLDCHSIVTGPRGLGKAYKPGEIRRYKRVWERHVQESRKIHRPNVYYKRELVSQIDMAICEILALPPNTHRIQELFRLLYELHIWRGSPEIDSKIIEGMSHLAIMGGVDQKHLGKYIPEFLWQMCWHYVGPHHVPIDKQDISHILNCVEILETLGSFNCEFIGGRKTIGEVTEFAEKFFEIGLWYSKIQISNRIIELYEKVLASCYSNDTLKFSYGYNELLKSLRNILSLLDEQKPSWTKLREKASKLLKN